MRRLSTPKRLSRIADHVEASDNEIRVAVIKAIVEDFLVNGFTFQGFPTVEFERSPPNINIALHLNGARTELCAVPASLMSVLVKSLSAGRKAPKPFQKFISGLMSKLECAVRASSDDRSKRSRGGA
jgi:hypothetical protein